MTDAKRDTTVGFIGLGKMGGGMARNTRNAGHAVVVYDINEQRCLEFEQLGAIVAESPASVAQRARFVITMVDTTQQTKDVTLGEKGTSRGSQPGDVLICMSTIDPIAIREVAEALAAAEVSVLDAPVSGMIRGADDGTLRAFVGGEAEALAGCKWVLEPMTSEIIHVGQLGTGLVMKLVNNMMYKVNSIAAIEGMVLGVKAGLEPEMILDVISKSTGTSPAFEYRAKRMIERNFDGVRLDISCKDLELETSLGSSLHVPLFMANVCKQVYEMGRAAGLGSQDATSIVTIYEQLTGVTVGSETA